MDGDICASGSAGIATRCLHTATSDTVAGLRAPRWRRGRRVRPCSEGDQQLAIEGAKGAKQHRSEAALRRGRARKRSPDA